MNIVCDCVMLMMMMRVRSIGTRFGLCLLAHSSTPHRTVCP